MKKWLLFGLIFVLIISISCLSCIKKEKESGSSLSVVSVSIIEAQRTTGPASIPKITNAQIDQLWKATKGSPDILIAVLDTGIDKKHRALAGKVVDEVNFTDSPTVSDVYGHGTHVAGTIVAAADYGASADYLSQGCRLLNVKVADDRGHFQSQTAAEGIRWAVDHGANIINISLSVGEPCPSMEEAVNYAWEKGVVVVAAAGTCVGNKIMYPAYYQNCLAVTAIDDNDCLVSWTNQSDWVDIAAPGINVYSTSPGNEYYIRSGTSMSAAYVSGLAGILFSLESDRNGNGFVNDEVRERIKNGTINVEEINTTEK